MAEDKKQEQEEEAKEAKAEKKEAPEEEKAPKVRSEKKSDKVSRLGIEAINEKLEEAGKKMGGLQSKYAQFLLARRDVLMRRKNAGVSSDMKRAA